MVWISSFGDAGFLVSDIDQICRLRSMGHACCANAVTLTVGLKSLRPSSAVRRLSQLL